ncbi:MAG: signal-transduction protein with cAMP-binding, CBS, and nucleotidyltransferase domain [Nitrospinales bacterium]|jgi:signal-transduction protein with cAMP-binding, CBS, and nucleotidyltransferase domain
MAYIQIGLYMTNKIIKEIMSPAHHVNSDVRVDEAITYMLSKDTGAILIKNEQGEYVGIFTKADLIKLLEKELDPTSITISSVMSSPIRCMDQTESHSEARQKMLDNNIRHYAVTDGKHIIGLLSNKDLNF